MIELHDDDLSNYGCVFELGGGKDGLMYPATTAMSPSKVLDVSGNGNHGTVTGAVHTDNDTALSFDGVNDIVTIKDTLPVSYANGITIATVFNINTKGTYYLISKNASGSVFPFRIYTTSAFISVSLNPGGVAYAKNINNFTVSVNNRLIVTYDNTTVKCYINGVLVSNEAYTTPVLSANTDLTLGARSDLNLPYLGKMKNTKIYNRGLNSEEVTTLNNDLLNGTTSITSGLVLDLPLNSANSQGVAPALVLDVSGNGNNGVNSGAVLVDGDSALSFDGVDDRITANPIVTGSQYTLATWLNVKNNQGIGTIGLIGRHTGAANANWGIAQIDTRFRAYVGNSYVQWSGNTINVNKYIVVRFNRPNLEIFANNVLVASGTIDADVTSNALAFFIGAGGSGYQNCEISKTKIFNIAITDEQRTTLYNGGSVTDGLVLDLPMNRLNCRTNSGIDTAGNNVITNYGATPCPDHNGRADRAWELSTTKYLEMASAMNQLSIANPFTILIAIQSNLTSNNFYWLVNYINANNKLSLYQTGNSFRFGVSDGITSYRKSSTMTNGWHFLAITWDLTTFSVKQNNSINWTNADGVNYPTTPFRISGDGKMDYLFIANRVLSASEIQKLYNYWRSH